MRQFLFVAFLFITTTVFSQTNTGKDSVPAYMHAAALPAFTVYKAPDSTLFTNKKLQKGKPLLLMIFSPDCGHCQHVATEIMNNINRFKNVQILMITWLPYSDMISFYKTYKIAAHPQIIMAWDKKYFFPPYYQLQTFPKLIVYDKKGKYVKEFQGEMKIEDVWKAFGK